MKISIVLILSMFLFSCSYKGFQQVNESVCIPDNTNSVYQNNLFPISTGYKWSYKMEYDNDYLISLSENEKSKLAKSYTLEIGAKKEIYYNKNGNITPIQAFTMIQDGKKSSYTYLIPCESGTNFVEVNNPEELQIVANLFISNKPNSDTIYWSGINKAKYQWLSTTTLDNPLEANGAYILQEYLFNEYILNPNSDKMKSELIFYKTGKSWYKTGIGLIKKDIYIGDKFIGVMSLEDYDLEKLSSPIEP